MGRFSGVSVEAKELEKGLSDGRPLFYGLAISLWGAGDPLNQRHASIHGVMNLEAPGMG